MKKKTNWIAVFACLVVFALMALGSGSSGSGETKEIVPSNQVHRRSPHTGGDGRAWARCRKG